MEAFAQFEQLLLGHLLDLVGGIAALESLAEGPALDRLRQDDRRLIGGLGRSLERGVDLLIVVPTPGQGLQSVVAQVLDELAQPRIGAEKVFADVGAVLDRVALVLAVDCLAHPVEQHAVDVAVQQFVPA